MEGRESKGGPPPSADLLVCFPSRAHFKLIPNKPICSPARPSEPTKRHHHHLKKTSNRGVGLGGGQASPLLWAKTKPMGSEIAEPTSPRVTCAGQIKVRRPKASSCKNWQSVMEEIERLHNNKKQKKRATWVESLGLKKDIMQFLSCLRRIKFDFHCFGSFPTTDLTSDDDDHDHDVVEGSDHHGNENSRTVFSKWFMVLQEDQNKGFSKEDSKDKAHKEEPVVTTCAPPPNALLLMRCRSAPAKSWLEEREAEKEEEDDDDNDNDNDNDDEEEDEEREEEEEKKAKLALEEEKRSKSLAVVMRYDNDFYKFSSNFAKETWIVGGMRDQFSRSKSWKR